MAAATILTTGAAPGETDAVVKVADKALIAGTVQLDNTGSRSTGDQIGLNANHSDGSTYLKLSYSLPFGSDGLRAGISASNLTYHLIGDDFAALKAKGDAQTYGINASYPLLRSGTKNVTLAAAYDRKDYYNEANHLATSEKRIDALLISLTADLLDGLGAGGMTLGGINLTFGDVDLSANPTNEATDRNGPHSTGGYHKLGYTLARLQRLTDKSTLWASLNGQIAGKNLDSSEKLSLGGASGVRAYPVMEGTGDDGWLATVEARYNLLPELQLSAFYDQGYIRRDHDGGYTGALTPASGTLKGAGLGVAWTQPGKYSLKAVLAHRIGDNPFRTLTAGPSYGKGSDGSYDRTRLWLSAVLFF